MKKTLLKSLLVAGMLAMGMGAWAQLEDGKYYLQNVSSGLWWGAANDWGTHASLLPHADFVTLAQQPDGTYTMETQVSNGGTNYYFGGEWMDGQPVNLTITAKGENFTIANGETYYGTANPTLANGTQNLGIGVDGTSDEALWKICTEADLKAALATATASEPVDATFLIIDHTFGRNNRNVGAWTVSSDCTNSNLTGGNSNKHCGESYHSVFTISQLLEDVPNGVYALTAQGFYRQDGADNDNLPVFFANNETMPVPLKTGTENSMADACTSFENGLYKIDPIYIEVTDRTINLGIQNPNNATLWVIWDNFELTYYGAASLADAKFGALIAQVDALHEEAIELLNKVEVSAVQDAIVAAIAATINVEQNEEALNAAIAILKEAVELGEASLIGKEKLAAMKELIDATNVYTEEAYKEYYGQWEEKYQAGTLTKNEANNLQDPSVVTGWHAAITVDNFLLSAWDTNPDFVDAPYYINTWSTEGDSDGSNFRVPFFEYWTGDANSLGERTLTATMENLPAGDYTVSAWTRARLKNGETEATANGITLKVNDGTAVDVTAGDQVGTTQFRLGEFNATGEVKADGVLKIQFIVAAENNVSWLSFKNVMFTSDVLTGIEAVNNTERSNTNVIYNLQGQQVKNAQKGLFIINGKKVVR